MKFSYYDLLGVRRDASAAEIKSAYRAALKRFHSDVGGSDIQATMFNEAYQVLSDPASRAAYDRELDGAATPAEAPAGQPAAAPEPDPVPWGSDDRWEDVSEGFGDTGNAWGGDSGAFLGSDDPEGHWSPGRPSGGDSGGRFSVAKLRNSRWGTPTLVAAIVGMTASAGVVMLVLFQMGRFFALAGAVYLLLVAGVLAERWWATQCRPEAYRLLLKGCWALAVIFGVVTAASWASQGSIAVPAIGAGVFAIFGASAAGLWRLASPRWQGPVGS